jgi:hypothetical protein
MLHAKDREYKTEKCRIARQSYVGGGYIIRGTHSVNPMQEPIFRNVTVNKGVSCNPRVAKDEKQSQRNASECCEQKKSEMLAQ